MRKSLPAGVLAYLMRGRWLSAPPVRTRSTHEHPPVPGYVCETAECSPRRNGQCQNRAPGLHRLEHWVHQSAIQPRRPAAQAAASRLTAPPHQRAHGGRKRHPTPGRFTSPASAPRRLHARQPPVAFAIFHNLIWRRRRYRCPRCPGRPASSVRRRASRQARSESPAMHLHHEHAHGDRVSSHEVRSESKTKAGQFFQISPSLTAQRPG